MGLSISSRSIVSGTSFTLGSEQWKDKSGVLLDLVKGFILDLWELRKVRLYSDNPNVDCVSNL